MRNDELFVRRAISEIQIGFDMTSNRIICLAYSPDATCGSLRSGSSCFIKSTQISRPVGGGFVAARQFDFN